MAATLSDQTGDCSPAKKQKLQENPETCNDGVHEALNDLSSFTLEKILHNNTNRKTVCLKGKFASKSGDALVLLEKTAFAEENLKADSGYFTASSSLEKVFHNDIYGNYKYFPEVNLNSIKATIIHPATEQHFQKYSPQNCHIIDETPQIYDEVVLPHLTSEQFNLNWVYNILEHKSEFERIVFEDSDPENGFILLPDLKWNGEIDTLYLLGICHKRDIKSLRDLTEEHLPLLKNIQKKGIERIKEKYGLDGSQLRIYLHYQPSFYHLHVHFTYIKHEAPGILAERAHLLSNVIKKTIRYSKNYKVKKSSTMSSKVKIYDSVILEIRPRLQSVNVLVNLLVNVEDIRLTLCDDSFKILSNEQVYEIACKNLKIDCSSLSSLVVAESYISFRFATATGLDDWGSFKTELLKAQKSTPTTITRDIFLLKSAGYNVVCTNCSQSLSDHVRFERVLPLPSDSAEPSDWFCHGHSHGHTSTSTPISVLDPKENDIFYSLCYCHLSKNLIKNVLEKDKLLICKRCLSWLGQAKNAAVYKFWFNTVTFKDGVGTHSTSPLSDVFYTIQDSLNNVLLNTAKLMLCCQSSKTQFDYILLWVLEKQLRVQISDFGAEKQDCKVAKVLFRYENGCSDIVKKWEEDASVVSVDISKPMITEVLRHLYKYNKIFPKVFSESNNFYISYLMMYEDNK